MKTREKDQNRLALEKSPYLLQHADNPVDWYPWGEEAFAKAAKEDKPIFLSIGYSTCHWCHVMEHESFEDPNIAKVMNQYFVSIKVDREERPDIDNIYMSAVTAMTGRGGWPLTVIMTPDKKPFYGGTYFPPYAKWGSPGLVDILNMIHSSWEKNRDELIESSQAITQAIKKRAIQEPSQIGLNEKILELAYEQLSRNYDSRFGGFGRAPKFPTSHNLSFLLRYAQRASSKKALNMVTFTLKKMAEGGMYDHLGGGFHRYSTDQQWQIPHFEKMLYDQAILARTYLEAYQITKDEFFAQIAREIFDYVLRDMQYPQGGFYSAEDADSLDPDDFQGMTPDPSQSLEKKEGAFYLWRHEEIRQILGEKDANIFYYRFGIQPNGNALSDPHNEFTNKNIIFVEHSLEETAKHLKTTTAEVHQSVKRSKKKLLNVRNTRPRPHLDDKILVDWNGLMISSLSFGARVLKEHRYLEAAQKAAKFIEKNLITQQNRLLHRYRDNSAGIDGMIEDYAFYGYGLWELYETTQEVKYLHQAVQLTQTMMEHFWDKKDGGFYFTAIDSQELLFRQKEIYDGAIPSGNSFAALNLARMYQLTLDKKWDKTVQELFQAFAQNLSQKPSAYTQMLIAFHLALGPSQEIVIAGEKKDPLVQQMLKKIDDYFLPNKMTILHPSDPNQAKKITALAPFVKNQKSIKGKTTAYVCENHICKLPVTKLKDFEKLLQQLGSQNPSL